MDEHKRIVEINGIKIEVDLRTAKRVDSYKVGDSVKVLIKSYSDKYDSHIGVITGFDEFKNLPTITVAYVVQNYSNSELKFISVNSQTKECEIAPLQVHEMAFSYSKAVASFDNEIYKKQQEIDEVQRKKDWFTKNYNHFFKGFTDVES